MSIAAVFERVGGVTKAARLLGLPVGTVSAWATRGRIPAERVLDCERALGVSREELRPDLYPPSSPVDSAEVA